MAIETSLYTALNSIVSGRFYPDAAPQGTAMPYATYAQVGGKAIQFIEPTVPSKKHARIQINVWAETRLQAMTLIRQFEDAVIVSPLFGVIEGAAVALYDEETEHRGAMQDFSFLY
jgi:hypothetical protein